MRTNGKASSGNLASNLNDASRGEPRIEREGIQPRLQIVDLAILPVQIIDVGTRVDRARRASQELVGFELATVLIDVLLQPAMQGAELALLDIPRDLRKRLEGRAVELGAQNVADRIALERAANHAGIPVHVLQAAVAVVRRGDPE